MAVLAVAVAGPVLASCDRQQPGAYEMADGVPEVRYVRPVKFAASDSLMTGAYMDNQICLVGENLRSSHIELKLYHGQYSDSHRTRYHPRRGERQDLHDHGIQRYGDL